AFPVFREAERSSERPVRIRVARCAGVDLEAQGQHQPKAQLRTPRPAVLGAERFAPLAAGALPQRSRSQGRPQGVAFSGLTLEGGGSEGNSLAFSRAFRSACARVVSTYRRGL